MKLVFNPEQLEVGEAIISSIDENIDDVSSNIKDDFNRISNTAMDKKINLSETIKWDDLDTDVSTFKNYLVDVTNVAKKAAVVCETYSNGNQTADDMNILFTSLNACKNVAEPDEFSKLLNIPVRVWTLLIWGDCSSVDPNYKVVEGITNHCT